MIRKITIVTLYFTITSLANHAQSDIYVKLIKSIKSECTTELKSYSINCSSYDKRIEDKLFKANIYLNNELTTLVLGDSIKFYNDKKIELEKLESKKPINTTEELGIYNEKENLYLLISLLKPSRSYSYFTKVIQCFYDLPSPAPISENSLSFFCYENWLYGLLEERFPQEKTYNLIQSALYYNRGTILLDNDFKDIETEKNLIREIDTLYQISSKGNYIEYTYSDMLFQTYGARAVKITKYFNNAQPTDDLIKLIEETYTKALTIKPNDAITNYNFGAFYYNLANRLEVYSKTITDANEFSKVQKWSMELFGKAQPYLDKAKSFKKND